MPQGNRPPSDRKHAPLPPKGPEKKFGPYQGGIGVSVWLNTTNGDDGRKRAFRSLTISPRRYRDRDTGEWRDSAFLYPADAHVLVFALQKAIEFVFTTPLPGDDPEHEPDASGRPLF
jgi:hypothetical protein